LRWSERRGARVGSVRGRALGTLALAVLAAGLAAPEAARSADDAKQLAQGKALFTGSAVPPCGLCHTLKDAGTSGAIGPPLDEIQPDAARVATALRNGIGAMPSYKATLKEDQIQALSRYVAKASGGAK
jgi:cytochrome c6